MVWLATVKKIDKIIPLAKAINVHNNQYSNDGADYSVTELLDPPRIILLNKRHGHAVEESIEQSISSFVGTAVHEYTERMLLKSDLRVHHSVKCEERMHIKVAGRDISGAYDILIDERELNDIKTTRVWNAVFGDHHKWEAQQNIYRYMYHKIHHKTIKKLKIIAIYLDWSRYRSMSGNDGGYPNERVVWYTLKKWPLKETEARLKRLVENIKQFEDIPDDRLPPCTDEDTWARGGAFAIKATGRKRALSLQKTRRDATEWIKTYLKSNFAKFTAGQLKIEERVPERIRCDSWCPINKYCNQYKEYHKKRIAMFAKKRKERDK